jgi:PAS domain S-box-containing protein
MRVEPAADPVSDALVSAGETHPAEVDGSVDVRLALALKSADMVAWEWNPVTDELSHSGNLAGFFGLTCDAVPRAMQARLALVHPADRARVQQALERARRDGAVYDESFRLVRPDGSLLRVADRGRAAGGDPGRPQRMCGVLRLLSESWHAEEEVRRLHGELTRQGEELRVLLDALPVGIFIAEDADCRTIRANPAGARMLGIQTGVNASKSAQGTRLPFRVLCDGVEVAPEDLPMQRAARLGRQIGGEEYDIVRDDGTVLRLHEYATPLFAEDGQVRGCVGVFVDVTAHRRAEEALRDSEERLRHSFESLLDAFALCSAIRDPQGQICDFLVDHVNDAACQSWRLSRDAVVGRPLRRLLPRRCAERALAVCRRVADTGEPLRADAVSLVDEVDGRRVQRWFDVALARLGDGFAVAWRDVTWRREAEEALRRSEEHLRLAQQAALLGSFEWNIAENRNVWSPELLALYGLRPGEFIGTHGAWLERVHPEDRERAEAAVRGALVTGSYDQDFRVVWPDGEVRWMHARARVFHDERGAPQAMIGVNLDITARKQAEEALRHSEARYRGLVENLPAITYVADPERPVRAVYVSPQVEAWLGVAPGEFEACPRLWTELVHPADRQRVLATRDRLVRSRQAFAVEYRVVDRRGRVHWIRDQGRWVHDDRGSPVCLQGVMLDISERKKDESALEELNHTLRRRLEELEALIEHSPVGIAVAQDAACRQIRINPVLAELLQVSRDINATMSASHEQPLPFRFCRDGRDIPVDQLPMQYAVAHGVAVENAEIDIVRPDGSERTILNNVQPLFDERGRVRGCVSVCTDISERKRAEELLRDGDRRKNEFLATLAHELRNPLAPIRNAVALLRTAPAGGPERSSLCALLDRQVQHLARLVDDLLDISRISRGKLELRRELTTLGSVVEQALETSEPVLRAAGHRLTVRLAGGLSVHADPTRLAQVLSNLLNNAAKYTAPGGCIELSAEAAGGQVVIAVKDDGIGMATERIPVIFDMFTQLDSTRELAQGGLGIGLTIARHLVEMHGGELTAASDGPGRGSVFTVRLPLATAAAAGPAARSPEPPPAARRRVLVADDNRDAADTLGMLLELLGHEARIVYDGAAALREAGTYCPDVAFLDIGMPELDGYEVARRLRAQPANRGMVLVALTGWGQASDRERSRQAGFDQHLVKPLAPEALQAVLDGREVPQPA